MRRCGMPRKMWLANIKDGCPLMTSTQLSSGFNVEGLCQKHPFMHPNDRLGQSFADDDYDDEITEISEL